MVTLQNVSRRAHVYILDAIALQEHKSPEFAHKTITAIVVHHHASGKLTPRRLPRLVPTSLSLLAGETRHDLPDAILDSTSVKNAIARNELRVLRQAEPKASAPPLSPPSSEMKGEPPPLAARASQRPPK